MVQSALHRLHRTLKKKFPRHIKSEAYTWISYPHKPKLTHTIHRHSCPVESPGCCNKGLKKKWIACTLVNSFQVSRWHRGHRDISLLWSSWDKMEEGTLYVGELKSYSAYHMNELMHHQSIGIWKDFGSCDALFSTITWGLCLIALTNCMSEDLLDIQIATPPSGLWQLRSEGVFG
jgi:hypothetical protein